MIHPREIALPHGFSKQCIKVTFVSFKSKKVRQFAGVLWIDSSEELCVIRVLKEGMPNFGQNKVTGWRRNEVQLAHRFVYYCDNWTSWLNHGRTYTVKAYIVVLSHFWACDFAVDSRILLARLWSNPRKSDCLTFLGVCSSKSAKNMQHWMNCGPRIKSLHSSEIVHCSSFPISNRAFNSSTVHCLLKSISPAALAAMYSDIGVYLGTGRG